MFEETPILGGDQRVDEVGRKLVVGHGVVVANAAAADLLAVAVLEDHGEILLLQPVLGGEFEGRDRQRQQHQAAGDGEREGLASDLDRHAADPGDVEAFHEEGEALVGTRRAVAAAPDRGIDPRIEREERAAGALETRRVTQPVDLVASRLDPRTPTSEPSGRRIDPGAYQPADEPVRELLQTARLSG